MAWCKRCGQDSWGRALCTSCRQRYFRAREAAYAQTQIELGPMTAENQDRFKRLVVSRTKANEAAAAAESEE